MLEYKIVHDIPQARGIIYMFEDKALEYDDGFTYVSLKVGLEPGAFTMAVFIWKDELCGRRRKDIE